MTNEEAYKWLENLRNDIGSLRYEGLWPYAQAIDEICGLLKEQDEIVRCKDCKVNNECSIQFKFADADNPGDWFCAYGVRR